MPPHVSSVSLSEGLDPSELSNFFEKFESGIGVWTESETEAVWLPAKVVSQKAALLTVVDDTTGARVEIDRGFAEVHPQNPKVVADMTALFHINEPGILHNLRMRSDLRDQRPYTFMGTLLICVNPLQVVPDPPMETYVGQQLDPEAPHPYAIAELAYHQMKLGTGGLTNQSVVVSGESGAGKTETSKIIIKYLAHRTQGGVGGLDNRVIESSPILESFGNAKTLRNANSSRFGKFLKLQFTADTAALAGGFMETYLLEKSRVLSQAQNERNFHILYELVAGADPALKKRLGLGSAKDYHILSQSGCTTLEGVDDTEQFRGVVHAFNTVGLSAEVQEQVWRMLAAVLHTACMKFAAEETAEGEVAAVPQKDQELIAELLGVTADDVSKLLTTRTMTTLGETFVKRNGLPEAAYARDAAAKALYESVFLWVVKTVSDSLGRGAEHLPFIGVLDIFGFENFARNEMEQLLINFTNESLQDIFNKQVFINEIHLYEQEGIEVAVSSCPDNSECIKLLSSKPNGIITLLDAVCREPAPTDEGYTRQLHAKHARDQHFPAVHKKFMKDAFMVRHYAGRVQYTVDGWITRNNDRIPEAFQDVLARSSLEAVQGAAKVLSAAAPAPGHARIKSGTFGGGAHARTKSSLGSKPTVARGFMDSMTQLQAVLEKTTCSFVRCIKPNADMKLGVFNNKYVVDQLQCLGILQTCEVLKVGLPTRVTYTELKDVLKNHAAAAEKLFEGEPEMALISAMLWAFDVPSDAFKLGKTRVFFKAGQIALLEGLLKNASAEKGDWIMDRLRQALADRQAAKAEAEEVDRLLKEAEDLYRTGLIDAGMAKKAASAVSCGPTPESLELSQTLKRVRKSVTPDQVEALIEASRVDNLGQYAPDAKAKFDVAAEDTLAKARAAKDAADALEAALGGVGGDLGDTLVDQLGDAVTAMQRARTALVAAARAAWDAADKCLAQLAKERAAEACAYAATVTASAATVRTACTAANGAADAQRAALAAATAAAPTAADLADVAGKAWTEFREVARQAQLDEDDAAMDARAKAAREQREREAAAAAAAAAFSAAAADEPPPPAIGRRSSDHKLSMIESHKDFNASQNIRFLAGAGSARARRQSTMGDLLDMEQKAEEEAKDEIGELVRQNGSEVLRPANDDMEPEANSRPVRAPRQPSMPVLLSAGPAGFSDGAPPPRQKTFHTLFEDAIAHGRMEGHLMKQSRFLNRWKPRYVVLEDGFLEYYDKKSYVNTAKKKSMPLQRSTVTSYTNTKNCFCVRTDEEVWFLLSQNEETMFSWMTAINAQVHGIYLKTYVVPEDKYWRDGFPRIREFYRMVDEAAAQWIRTYPELDAPRTGEGLFPGEVIEVVQRLTVSDVVYLRLADDRGWMFLRNPQTNSVMFAEVGGTIVEDKKTYGLPSTLVEPVPIFFGPGNDSQLTGEMLEPGDKVKACERFIPHNASDIVFIKLADGRGWMPVRKKADSASFQLANT